MGAALGDAWHGLEQFDPTGLATRTNKVAEGVWNNNAAHGTEPDFSQQQPQQNPYFNQQPVLNLPPDATGQGTGQPVQPQSPMGWAYVQGQGPVWQGGGGGNKI